MNLNDGPLSARERLGKHTGSKIFQDHQAFEISLNRVYAVNYQELKVLLDQAATDVRLGIELVQNVRDDTIAREFRAEVGRRLHNYVASYSSLVDSSRRIVKGNEEALGEGWATRKAAIVNSEENAFVKDLRNYSQHWMVPILGHSLRMANLNTPDSIYESEVELSPITLLDWGGWTSLSQAFLKRQVGGIAIRIVVESHFELVWESNNYLLSELRELNRDAMVEVNRLIVEASQEQFGCTFEVAERMTRERTERQMPPGQRVQY